jgi:hypothetical protein
MNYEVGGLTRSSKSYADRVRGGTQPWYNGQVARDSGLGCGLGSQEDELRTRLVESDIFDAECLAAEDLLCDMTQDLNSITVGALLRNQVQKTEVWHHRATIDAVTERIRATTLEELRSAKMSGITLSKEVWAQINKQFGLHNGENRARSWLNPEASQMAIISCYLGKVLKREMRAVTEGLCRGCVPGAGICDLKESELAYYLARVGWNTIPAGELARAVSDTKAALAALDHKAGTLTDDLESVEAMLRNINGSDRLGVRSAGKRIKLLIDWVGTRLVKEITLALATGATKHPDEACGICLGKLQKALTADTGDTNSAIIPAAFVQVLLILDGLRGADSHGPLTRRSGPRLTPPDTHSVTNSSRAGSVSGLPGHSVVGNINGYAGLPRPLPAIHLRMGQGWDSRRMQHGLGTPSVHLPGQRPLALPAPKYRAWYTEQLDRPLSPEGSRRSDGYLDETKDAPDLEGYDRDGRARPEEA